jgi:hypothetical protein
MKKLTNFIRRKSDSTQQFIEKFLYKILYKAKLCVDGLAADQNSGFLVVS